MVRSCATQDAVNKDNVCTPTISAGINRAPHPDHLAYTLELRDHGTRLASKDSFLGARDLFYIRWKSRRRTAWSDGDGRRSDPTNACTRADAADAEYRSGSDTKEGERLLLGT